MDYGDNLGVSNIQEGLNCDSLLKLHARMFARGDKYDFPALMEVAVWKYATRCSKLWVEFLGSISEVYGYTHDSLRPLREEVIRLSRDLLPATLNDENVIQRLLETKCKKCRKGGTA